VTDEDVGVGERRHRGAVARSVRVLRITSSHAAFRLAAGTEMLPASDRRSGVRASMARCPSTRKITLSQTLSEQFGRVVRHVLGERNTSARHGF
jgi:hypothetical protein